MASKVQQENAKIVAAQKGQAAARATKRISASTGQASTSRPMTKQEKARSGPAVRSTPVAKAGTPAKSTTKAPATKSAPVKASKNGASQADQVRAFLQKNPDARPVDVAKATGVDAAYVWDIRQAMRRKAEAHLEA